MPKKKLGPILIEDKSFFVCRHCGVSVVWTPAVDEATVWGGWTALDTENPSHCDDTPDKLKRHNGKEITDHDVVKEFVGILRELS